MEDAQHFEPVLLTVALYLTALVAGILAFRRLGLGAALGYLVVGAVAGPAVLGLLDIDEVISALADFGVVLFLFVIGLELRPARIWRLRVDLLGLGGGQLLVTWLVLGSGFHFALGWEWGPSVVAGAALALSSTAFGVQMLDERGAIGTPFADRAISILLFQDIALVPLIAMVALFSEVGLVAEVSGQGSKVAIGLATLAALIVVGHFLIDPFFRMIARTAADEAFTASALLVVAAAALATDRAGLGVAMGGVIAGALLAESEFRHRVEEAVEPFRGLLIGVFFVGVGAQIDWIAVAGSIHIAIIGAAGLFLIKTAILLVLVRLRGANMHSALRTAVLLGQSGEFGFVLFGLAATSGVLDGAVVSVLSATIALSMAMTPVAMKLADRWIARQELRSVPGKDSDFQVADDVRALTVLVGCGRFGQTVAEVLRRRGHELLLIDSNPDRVRVARAQGHGVIHGDAAGNEVLRAVRRRGVRAFFICVDDPDRSLRAVSNLRGEFPDALIFVRTANRLMQWEAIEVGADFAVREVFESALIMAHQGLEHLGDGDAADEVIAEFRREDAEEFGAMQARYTRAADAFGEGGAFEPEPAPELEDTGMSAARSRRLAVDPVAAAVKRGWRRLRTAVSRKRE